MALFEGERLCDRFAGREATEPAGLAWLSGHRLQRAVVSSTRGDAEQQARQLEAVLHIPVLAFTPATEVPLGNDYATPETLGCDRLAAAVGAEAQSGGRPVLIVDFGTAITFDTVAGGRFRGGFISPGLSSRLRALHDYTATLPQLDPAGQPEPDETLLWQPGRTTRDAMWRGVVAGICAETEAHIARRKAELGEISVIFTGGDAEYFVKRIKNTIFADRDLVFRGLNRILAYHDKSE